MNREFYVYIYWRLDTNEVFYVGKGKGDRWKVLNRKHNEHFTNIINKHPVAVEIIKDNLTENEALYWEEKIINTLVFEYDYSIDIPNNRSNEKGKYLVNKTWGGEGTSGVKHTEEWRQKHSKRMKGEDNPFYGKHHSEEAKRKISKNRNYRNGRYNENSKWIVCLNTNEIFFSHVLAQEKYNAYDISKVLKRKRISSGKFSDGTRLYWMSFKDYIRLKKEDIERIINEGEKKYKEKQTSIKNPSAKPVICLTTEKIFYTIKEASMYYKSDNTGIVNCCKYKQSYCGKLDREVKLMWMYLEDFLNKCKYILL